MVMTVCGFVAIFLLKKLTIIHSEKQHDAPGHHHHVGLACAIGLSFHSFLDGLAIGVGFQAGTKVGIIVLLAVVGHDFADGLNTVTFMLATKNSTWRTASLLVVDAVAPVFGAALTSVVHLDAPVIAFQLAFFAAFSSTSARAICCRRSTRSRVAHCGVYHRAAWGHVRNRWSTCSIRQRDARPRTNSPSHRGRD